MIVCKNKSTGIVVRALQYTGKNIKEILSKFYVPTSHQDFFIELIKKTGAKVGDYIIKDEYGNFLCINADIINSEYEIINEDEVIAE